MREQRQQKFLGCLFEPCKALVCQKVSLQFGIFFISVIDVFVSCAAVIGFLLLLDVFNSEDEKELEKVYPSELSKTQDIILVFAVQALDKFFSVMSLPFAIKGFQGAIQEKKFLLQLYSHFKHVELFVLVAWCTIMGAFLYSSLAFFFFVIIIRLFWDGFWTYVVWSAYKTLAANGSITYRQEILFRKKLKGDVQI